MRRDPDLRVFAGVALKFLGLVWQNLEAGCVKVRCLTFVQTTNYSI